jgi:hypothetical protein
MEFKAEEVPEFRKIFEVSQPRIAAFPGCQQVRLYQDAKMKNVFFTHSLWESEEDLERYRNSELFKGTWAKTKVLFDAKPMAFSLIQPD